MRALPNSTKSTVIVVGAALLLILLLKWAGSLIIVEKPTASNDRFGLAFISTPDDLADEPRYQGALATGARWDRWPLYWHWVAEGGYTGPHQDGVHDYDTLITFSGAWLDVSLSVEDQQHDLIAVGELWQNSDWKLKSLDLSLWQGQTVEIQFQVIHCSEQSFKATLDRVSVGS